MELRENLTNEGLSYKFESQFELVNYAIRLAENMIRSGREPRVKTEVQNSAMLVVAEMVQGKDQFDEIPPKAVHVMSQPALHDEAARYEKKGFNLKKSKSVPLDDLEDEDEEDDGDFGE